MLVDLDLRKIGVDGQVEVERRGNAYLGIEAGIVAKTIGLVCGIIFGRIAQRVGDDGDVGTRPRRRLIPQQYTRIGQRGCRELPRHRCPGRLFGRFEIHAAKVDAPAVDTIFVAQGFERHRHFEDPLIVFGVYGRRPLIVPAQVDGSPFEDQSVPLRTLGIGAEGEAIGLVIERIEEDDKIVIAAKAEVAPQRLDHIGPFGPFVANGQQVYVVLVVQHAYLRAYLRAAGIHG